MYAYKVDLVQHLRIGDSMCRLEFINHILWIDQSKFINNRVMNKQIMLMIETHIGHVTLIFKPFGEKCMVLVDRRNILGLYMFDGLLNGRRYLYFLTNQPPILLDNFT